jgi:signal transduction histidine kinase
MIQEFITTGLTDEERARIGPPPVGHGLLGVIIREGRALRLNDLTRDPRSQGFPPNHPPMRSLLGVPVISRGETIGNLYLTDKLDAAGFSDADEEMVRTFANYAAVAVETSRLQDELRSLAVVKERERIGMDLHDGIIQAIYAVGLSLDGAAEDVTADPDAARRALDDAIDRLNAVIRDVRSYIFELRPARLSEDLRQSLRDLAQDFQVNSLIETSLEVPDQLPPLREEQRRAIFHVAQEALVNARKHAKATQAAVVLRAVDGALELEVSDNGTGFDTSVERGDDHRGLRNMAARAHAAGGTIQFDSRPGAGTTVRAQFPTAAGEATRERIS